jgi:hypothetical protein
MLDELPRQITGSEILQVAGGNPGVKVLVISAPRQVTERCASYQCCLTIRQAAEGLEADFKSLHVW